MERAVVNFGDKQKKIHTFGNNQSIIFGLSKTGKLIKNTLVLYVFLGDSYYLERDFNKSYIVTKDVTMSPDGVLSFGG